ncbi:MAG TPA: glycosyltransferase family 9 protein, partial [Bryobacteraceae bacterium]|nr:glycosyltransferase family 9 protein [Bryobacteraceae bacterium]
KWILERDGPQVDGVEVEPAIDDLHELACRLAQARLYIGNDSGITHLAAASGVPVLALFGPTDPAVWAPRGPNVRVIATERPGESMEQIDLAKVLKAGQTLAG